MDNTKLHYYCFSFKSTNGISTTEGSAYIGYVEKDFITMARLNAAKAGAEMPQNAVVVSISYLGYMTPEEFRS